MLYKLLRSLLMPPSIYSSVLTFALLNNQRHPILALDIFVGICTSSSKTYQSGMNKVINVLLLIINHPYFLQRRKTIKFWPRVKPPGYMALPTKPTIIGIQIHPICDSLINMDLLTINFFYHLNKMMEICLMIKFLGKMEKKVNPTNTGSPVQPRCQYLLNMILMVTYFF